MGTDAQRATIDLGNPELRIVGGDHDVGIAGNRHAAPEAVAVHRGDHRYLAVVDRCERLPTALADLHERLIRRVGSELFDVDTDLESAELRVCRDDHDVHVWIAPVPADGLGELRPAGDGERIHRRVVDDDLGDVVAHLRANHGGERT